MSYYILTYETITTYLEKRAQYREEHLNLANKYVDLGQLIMGGALENPADKAVLVFKCDEETVKKFVANDPYVKNGLVNHWHIRKWNVVVENNKK